MSAKASAPPALELGTDRSAGAPGAAKPDVVTVFRLALSDFLYEWRLSVCFVMALAAVLAPLLVLFGLKFGLINTIASRLIEDPSNREVMPIGAGRFDRDFFAALRAREDVGFVVPRTRTISATIFLRNPERRGSRPISADLIPTARGDPLLADQPSIPSDPRQVILSTRAAQALGVAAGESIEASVTRTREGRRERATLEVYVLAVAREAAFIRAGAFSHLDLLLAVEDYRDGRAVPRFAWDGDPNPDAGPRLFAGYRLFATSIYSVADLRDWLRGQGLEVRTRAAEIDVMQSLDRNLTVIFWLIAGIGIVGFVLSLGSSLWANVDRKRKDLSVLRLLGLKTLSLIWFPVFHALFTSLIGSLVAGVFYLAISSVLNGLFAQSRGAGEFVCQLLPQHLLLALVGTVVCAMLASSLAGLRSALIEPADGLRDV